MNRVFQTRALTALVLDLHTLNVFWSPDLALNSATLRWKRNVKGMRARYAFRIMYLPQDELSGPRVRPWMDFLDSLSLSLPLVSMSEPPDLSPFTCLTRLSCWYIPGMQFPESLIELDLNLEEPGLEDVDSSEEEIAFSPRLERLDLHVKLLDGLGPKGLPRLESLRIFSLIRATTHVYQAKKNWPPSLKSVTWYTAIDVSSMVVVCSRSWLEQLPNLTFLTDMCFRIEDLLVLPESLKGCELSDTSLLPESFSGLPNLTDLSFRWVNLSPDYYMPVLEQVQKTLKVLKIMTCSLENLPVLPRLDLLDCMIEPEVLPLLNQRIPQARFLDLLLLLEEDIDLDCSLFPRTCKALILRFDSHRKPCKIRIHGPLPESLEFLSLNGTNMVLESPLPRTIQRLDLPKNLIDASQIPEWVLFS